MGRRCLSLSERDPCLERSGEETFLRVVLTEKCSRNVTYDNDFFDGQLAGSWWG